MSGVVKVYKHTDTGAPQLTGQVGRAVQLYDAVLVNGYNQIDISSLERSASIVTVTTSKDHGYKSYDVILISGADQTEYNNEFRITIIDSRTFTFAIAGEPITPATGSIKAKISPAGFSKPFEGVNKAVYRSNDLSSDRRFFRIVDDGSTSGGASEFACQGYESMTSVDVGDGVFPTTADYATGHYCRKSSTNSVDAKPWVLVSNGKTVYLFVEYSGNALYPHSGGITHTMSFGDSIKLRPTDQYSSFVSGNTSANSTGSPSVGIISSNTAFSTPSKSSSICLNRDINGVSLGRYARPVGISFDTTVGYRQMIRYPNESDKSLIIGPLLIGHDDMWRSTLPGLYDNMHGRVLSQGEIIENIKGYEGRKFMMQYVTNNSAGCFFIDITGPWE